MNYGYLKLLLELQSALRETSKQAYIDESMVQDIEERINVDFETDK